MGSRSGQATDQDPDLLMLDEPGARMSVSEGRAKDRRTAHSHQSGLSLRAGVIEHEHEVSFRGPFAHKVITVGCTKARKGQIVRGEKKAPGDTSRTGPQGLEVYSRGTRACPGKKVGEPFQKDQAPG